MSTTVEIHANTLCLCSNKLCNKLVRFDQRRPVLDFGKLIPGSPVPAGACPKCESLLYLATQEQIDNHNKVQIAPADVITALLTFHVPQHVKQMAFAKIADGTWPRGLPEAPMGMGEALVREYLYAANSKPLEWFRNVQIYTKLTVLRETEMSPDGTLGAMTSYMDDHQQTITQDSDGSALLKNPADKALPPTSTGTKEEINNLINTIEKQKPEETFTVYGEHGELTVNLASGKVIGYSTEGKHDKVYADISCFDLNTYKQENPAGIRALDKIDIIHFNFWSKGPDGRLVIHKRDKQVTPKITITAPPTIYERQASNIEAMARDWAKRWLCRQGIRKKLENVISKPNQFEPEDVIFVRDITSVATGALFRHMFFIVKKSSTQQLKSFSGYSDKGKNKFVEGYFVQDVSAVEQNVWNVGLQTFNEDLSKGDVNGKHVMLHPKKVAKRLPGYLKHVVGGKREADKVLQDVTRLLHQHLTIFKRVGDFPLVQVYATGMDSELVNHLITLPTDLFVSLVPKKKKPIAAVQAAYTATEDHVKRLKVKSRVVLKGPKSKFKPYPVGTVLLHKDASRMLIVNRVPQLNDRVFGEVGISLQKGEVVPKYQAFNRREKNPVYSPLDHVILPHPVRLDARVILNPQLIAKHWKTVTKDMNKKDIARLFDLCKKLLSEVMFVRGLYTGGNGKKKQKKAEVAWGPGSQYPGQGHRCDLPVAFLSPLKVTKR